MSDEPEPPLMKDEDFNQCFGALQTLEESGRKLIYAFVLIYGALSLWALNALVYPSEQQRLGAIMKKDVDTIRCLIALEKAVDIDEKCSQNLGSSLYYRVKAGLGSGTTLPAGLFDPSKIDSDYMLHELEYQLDRSSQVSQFNVPLFGITSDRAWLWVVNIVLGPLFYFLIRGSLGNIRFLLTALYNNCGGRRVRLLLLAVIQIVSSSPQRIDMKGEDSGAAKFMSRIKFISICAIFTLPILVSGFVLYDWFYFTIVLRSADFRAEPEFVGGILTMPATLLEVWWWWHICILLSVLFRLHNEIRGVLRSSSVNDLVYD